MSMALTPGQEEIISGILQNGRYKSAEEIIDESLRLFEEAELRRKKLEQLKTEIDKAAAQLDRGEFTEWDSADALIEHVKAEGRNRFVTESETRGR